MPGGPMLVHFGMRTTVRLMVPLRPGRRWFVFLSHKGFSSADLSAAGNLATMCRVRLLVALI